MLHTKLYFGNCSHFSEREENGERLAVNKLSFPNNRSSYVRRLLTEYLTKDTAVSQKCQQNVSKIAQLYECKLPSAAIIEGSKKWVINLISEPSMQFIIWKICILFPVVYSVGALAFQKYLNLVSRLNISQVISWHGRRPVSTIVLHLKRKSLFWRLPSVDKWGAIGSNLGRDAAN